MMALSPVGIVTRPVGRDGECDHCPLPLGVQSEEEEKEIK
jgi:hypothetical protein